MLASVQAVFAGRTQRLSNRIEYMQKLSELEHDLRCLSREFVTLDPERGDFEFGFHAWPDSSVGHLHMHVFPKRNSLRQFSTREHDWKTIPLKAVLEAEAEVTIPKVSPVN